MEKFEVFVVFIAATYKPSNTIWPVISFKSASEHNQHNRQVCFNHYLWLQLCLPCYSLIGISPTMPYRPVSLQYPQRSVNKKAKFTRDKFNKYLCHHCNNFLAVGNFLSYSFFNYRLLFDETSLLSHFADPIRRHCGGTSGQKWRGMTFQTEKNVFLIPPSNQKP